MRARVLAIALLTGISGAGCKPASPSASAEAPAEKPAKKPVTLSEARQGFATHLLRQERTDAGVEPPPPGMFNLVRYQSPAGSLPAYVGVAPADHQKRPAIIWLVGGFSNSISGVAWEPSPADNDQSASAFREAGIVMMYPALRGGNDHPGAKEGFYGEVDDVLAAADYLSKVDYVDPARIYLGGHSTGGTLALLVAESSSRFRAVFSFGPVEDVAGYGSELLPFDLKDKRELRLRAPGNFLGSIGTATFVFEGAKGRSNIDSLRAMAGRAHSPFVHFHEVRGADHFSTLAPLTRTIAQKILADDQGPTTNIAFTEQEISLKPAP